MKNILRMIVDMINMLHDIIILFFKTLGFSPTDKQLHFIVFGVFGIASFVCIDYMFKFIGKRSITALSFIYTLTILFVFAVAVEIQQGVTNSGNMELYDIYAGIYGFLGMFAIYVTFKSIILHIRRLLKK